jgi:hypothetical protein
MGDEVLADPQGQAQLPVADSFLNQAFNNALDTEATLLCSEIQESGRRAEVAEPGSQAPGVTISGVALRLPQVKFPSDNQSATASGQSPQEVSTKVSAGTSLMTVRKAARCICFGK